jgi:outer membrane protein assembly factor BamB
MKGLNITSENTAVPSLVILATAPHVTGINAADGTVLWKQTIGDAKEPGKCAVAFLNDKVVVARAHEIRCLRQMSGEVVWRANTPFSVNGLLVEGDRVIIARGGEVAAFDASGKLLWHETLREGVGTAVTLAAFGNVVAFEDV